MKNKLHIFENPQLTAKAVAQILVDKINGKNDFFYLAISGGNTPKILFEILAFYYSHQVHWNKLKLFWVDERCVLPTDNESNFKMTYDTLLSKVAIPHNNIFRIKGENIPEIEAKEYQQKLNANIPIVDNFPAFDLTLLGIGDDGHTASIFPDNLSLLNISETVTVAIHPLTGQKRITLTGNIIRNSNQIFFIITGKSKYDVFNQIFTGNNTRIKYPAYHIIDTTNAEVFVDKAVVDNKISV